VIEIRTLETDELLAWNSMVARFPNATLFHTMEWLNFLGKIYHLEKLPLGLYLDGRMVGLFPMLLTRKGPFRILGSPLTGWGTPCMGPLVEAGLLNEAMHAFDDYVKRLKVHYVEVRFPQADLTLPGLTGFHREPVYTYILNLDGGEEAVWNKLKGTCRTQVRKAIKNNVKIIEPEDRSWVEEFFPMLLRSFSKTGQVPARNKEFYYCLWDDLKPAGKLKVLFAEYEGKRIAAGVFLVFRDTVYFNAGGAYGEYKRVAPNNLIHWHLIKWAIANGFQKYDLCGKGIETIDRFKETFGPDVAARTQFAKAIGLSARLGKAVYGELEPAVRSLQYQINRLGGVFKKSHNHENIETNVSGLIRDSESVFKLHPEPSSKK
jgi:CelD/BcsL family acetyltransferase involved in cellulose biosynthesis